MTEPEHATTSGRAYLPGMPGGAPQFLYDVMSRVLGAGPSHRRLVEQADPPRDGRVLEIGCGTGNVLAAVARRHPDVELIGLDPDPAALARARTKLGDGVRLEQGFADDLPLPDGHVDRVLSSLMLHHLPADQQARALREARRVLRPGGTVHIVDMEGERSTGPVSRAAGAAMHAISRVQRSEGHGHGHGHTHGHGHEEDLRPQLSPVDDVVALLTDAGFVDAEVVERRRWVFGTLAFYRARVTAAG
ncbi:ubiquinone/menaquinone biosynthesis C-methylase UbiE [Actinomycetospora succinea]|uniref:Ubiquinone/menaquinone biosynthesis C-methylase UbiE n=1 Tax=Actinomycetospora succinea TaxID=663603 RepID=A0A4R6UWA6_9PSEU|nr:class I SAM-dependent methyltransferase [Actinomycetospora succinea]TDQ51678.1 ubiquinone/menaquinone biosynthesis C-methylase UbiE [Actinomycetospora succinea]